MAAKTSSQNLMTLADQLLAGAREATGAEREQMLAMAQKFADEAAELRVAEAAEERASHEFWRTQDVLTNWVS